MVDDKRIILIADDRPLLSEMASDFVHTIFPNEYTTEIFPDGVKLGNRL